MYYRNGTGYTVKVLKADGSVAGAGEEVTFNIIGQIYKRTTDANGVARLNINLAPGDYVITAEYNSFKVSNNIKVLPVLTASNLIKTYTEKKAFKVNVVDGHGNPVVNGTVSFNIIGVLYNRITDANGTASLNINLMPGEYIITSSYNGATTSNTITVTEG